jgi:hypothetical protein
MGNSNSVAEPSFRKHPLSLITKARWKHVRPQIAESEAYSLAEKQEISNKSSSVKKVSINRDLAKLRNFNSGGGSRDASKSKV